MLEMLTICASASRCQKRQKCFHHAHYRPKVNFKQPGKFFKRYLFECSSQGNTSAIHQHIRTAVPALHNLRKGSDGIRIGDIKDMLTHFHTTRARRRCGLR